MTSRQISPEARKARRELATSVLRALAAGGAAPTERAFKGAAKMGPHNRLALLAWKVVDAFDWWEERSLEEPDGGDAAAAPAEDGGGW